MVIRIVPVIISLLLAWYSKRHRNLLLITTLTLSLGIILTIIWVYPINEAIMAKAGEGSSPAQIKRMVSTWILADRVRFTIIFIGYFFLLWAFRVPISFSKQNPDNATAET